MLDSPALERKREGTNGHLGLRKEENRGQPVSSPHPHIPICVLFLLKHLKVMLSVLQLGSPKYQGNLCKQNAPSTPTKCHTHGTM